MKVELDKIFGNIEPIVIFLTRTKKIGYPKKKINTQYQVKNKTNHNIFRNRYPKAYIHIFMYMLHKYYLEYKFYSVFI